MCNGVVIRPATKDKVLNEWHGTASREMEYGKLCDES